MAVETTGRPIISISQIQQGVAVLGSYASDAAFVSAKGSAATNSDIYYETTNHYYRLYANGAWTSLVDLSTAQVLTNKTIKRAVVSKTATYTATTADHTILCDASGGAITINLPAASGNTGLTYVIKKTDSSLANAVTIDPNASETIDGSTTTTLNTQYERVEITCDGTGWQTVLRGYPQGRTSFTPGTAQGFGTTTNVECFWSRRGDGVRIEVSFTMGTAAASEGRVSLPTNMTIGTLKASGNYICGRWTIATASATTVKAGTIQAATAGTYFTFGLDDYTGSTGAYTAINIAGNMASAGAFSFFAEVPISGWKG